MPSGGHTTAIQRVLERRAEKPPTDEEGTTATVAVMVRVLPPPKALLVFSDPVLRQHIERRITAHHVAHEVPALLVARDRERHHGALTDGSAEPQPAVQQRCVTRETKRIPGIVRFGRHEAHPARKRPTASAIAIG